MGARAGERSLQHSVAISTIAEAGVLVLSLIALRAAAAFGPAGFGLYAVARRALQLIAYPALCGLGISFPRTLAYHRATGDPRSRAFVLAALAVVLPVLAVLALIAVLWPATAANVIYGEPDRVEMVRAVMVAAAGLTLHTLAHGLYRGRTQFARAAALQLLSAGVAPVVAILLAATPEGAVLLTGIFWLTAGGSILVAHAFAPRTPREGAEGIAAAVRELLGHGIPRVPAELALFGFFALPVLLVAHRQGAVAAGFLSLGLSIVSLVVGMLAGLGVVLLPHVSRAAAAGELGPAARAVDRLLWPVVAATLAISLGIFLSARPLLSAFLGSEYADAAESVRIVVLGTAPYAAYMVLRNPLDAVRRWPYNSVNLIIALGAALVLPLLGIPGMDSPVAIALAMTLLGLLSLASWRHAIRIESRDLPAAV